MKPGDGTPGAARCLVRRDSSREHCIFLSAAPGVGWPRVYSEARGDLGCLLDHARKAGYRADVLAERLGETPRSMRSLFRRYFGIPLKVWLGQVRAVEVRHRLRGSESFKEIAHSVGFCHPKELSREVARHYGMTPRELRRRERARSHDPD
jgi:AraC-like DNA-binding protein